VPGTENELQRLRAISARDAEAAQGVPYRLSVGRAHRIEVPGIHHVVTRGNNKQPIYLDDTDRSLWCLRVDRTARKFDWRVLAGVAMRNHYHLLLSAGDRGLSAGMCELNKGHALTFNARHGRINHLFGKRFWSRYLRTEAAVMNAARYIVQNPMRAGSSRALEEEPWSSFATTVGVAYSPINIDRETLLAFFGLNLERAVREFRRFCDERPGPRELDEM
jgi:putative transposase